MFCSECGKRAHGKFCSHCGTPLDAAETAVVDANVVPAAIVPDWNSEVEYQAILKFPGVQELIERHARQAPKRLSGEEFLTLANKLVPTGVPIDRLAVVIQPLYARLGIKTGKQRVQQIATPVSRVIVRTLCSLARHAQPLRQVTQAADGCLLEAALPSDPFSFEGDLLVSVRRSGSVSEVSGATRISGQLFDWGKSNRCLNRLFDDLARDAA